MVFFNLGGGVWSCSLSMILLNYNCGITSYVLYIINNVDSIGSGAYAFATLSLMLGLLIGQIIFGIFGDTFGRKRSFQGSALLLFLGSFLSIFSGITSSNRATIAEFSCFRFIVGLGAGGMYPLVAAIARETSQEDLANTKVALVFGPYGSLGLILAPLVVWIMTHFEGLNDDYKWRIILAIGAIPVPLLMITDYEETLDPTKQYDFSAACANWFVSLTLFKNELSVGFHSPTLRSYFIGSSLSWFFSDILHYGNILMQAKFLENLLKEDPYDDDYVFSINSLALMGIAAATCFWIGGMISVPALREVSALALQLHGFALTSAAFFLVCLSKVLLPSTWWPLTIILYALTYIFNGFGPAPTTFLIPSLLFPPSIRSTANGLAAAIGKLGSIAGIGLGGYIGLEISNLMACFGAVALMGVGTTLLLIQANFKKSLSKSGELTSNNEGGVLSRPKNRNRSPPKQRRLDRKQYSDLSTVEEEELGSHDSFNDTKGFVVSYDEV